MLTANREILLTVKGRDGGTQHLVKGEICRIGNAPHCDIRLERPELKPLVLVLEQHQGQMRLHNRGEEIVQLGQQTLHPLESGTWATGESVRIADGTQLELTSRQNLPTANLPMPNSSIPPRVAPTPVGRPKLNSAISAEHKASPATTGAAAPNTSPPEKSISKTILELLVIVLLFGIAGYIFLLPPAAVGDTPAKRELGVADVLAGLKPHADLDRLFGVRLQEARQAEIRDQNDVARQKYQEVQNLALQQLANEQGANVSRRDAVLQVSKYAIQSVRRLPTD